MKTVGQRRLGGAWKTQDNVKTRKRRKVPPTSQAGGTSVILTRCCRFQWKARKACTWEWLAAGSTLPSGPCPSSWNQRAQGFRQRRMDQRIPHHFWHLLACNFELLPNQLGGHSTSLIEQHRARRYTDSWSLSWNRRMYKLVSRSAPNKTQPGLGDFRPFGVILGHFEPF